MEEMVVHVSNGERNLDATSLGSFKMIEAERVGAKQNVGLVRLNRPKAMNALCDQLIQEVCFTVLSRSNLQQTFGAFKETETLAVF